MSDHLPASGMNLRTGVDLIEIARVAEAVSAHGDRFLERVFTPAELAYCRGRRESLAALLLALSSSPAHAATLTVTPGAAGINGGDGCSLVEAIINANNNAATHGECVAGSGADTIVLAGNTYSYSTANGTGTALPDITSPITIQANGATIQRAAGAPNMRIIRVNAGGNLTLNNATITGGVIAGGNAGGGIYNNAGTLTLNNSTIRGNFAVYGGGISTGNSGTTTLNNSTISGNQTSLGGGGIDTFNNSTTTLNNSTVTGNTATPTGGGIASNTSSTVILVRTIVSGNTALNGQDVWRNPNSNPITAANHNFSGIVG